MKDGKCVCDDAHPYIQSDKLGCVEECGTSEYIYTHGDPLCVSDCRTPRYANNMTLQVIGFDGKTCMAAQGNAQTYYCTDENGKIAGTKDLGFYSESYSHCSCDASGYPKYFLNLRKDACV